MQRGTGHTVCLLLVVFLSSALSARLPGSLPKVVTKSIESLRDFKDGDDQSIKAHWALLIAGSMGWGNYRHQADVCHAYQVLKQGGLDDDHIVVMIYDDIANNPENPHPGKIFNRPGGPDVYQGVPKDYVGRNVNSQTFLSVLAGDKAAVEGKGTGKVIASGPDDRVFVFYSDHGAPGILGMPSGPFLYADQLMTTLTTKANDNGFKEMVLYIEACEAGSMFDGLLNDNLDTYAVTAANPYESSWGTYCPGMDPSPPPEFTTCLGDLFSVAWMENSEVADLAKETLHSQFKLVRKRTANNYTYMEGSHAMQYGEIKMDHELAGDYLGMQNSGPERVAPEVLEGHKHHPKQRSVLQRDAELHSLRIRASHEKEASRRAELHSELAKEVHRREKADATAAASAVQLLRTPSVIAAVARHMGQEVEELVALLKGSLTRVRSERRLQEGVVEARRKLQGGDEEQDEEREVVEEEGDVGVWSWWMGAYREWRKHPVNLLHLGEGERRGVAPSGYWKWSWVWDTIRGERRHAHLPGGHHDHMEGPHRHDKHTHHAHRQERDTHKVHRDVQEPILGEKSFDQGYFDVMSNPARALQNLVTTLLKAPLPPPAGAANGLDAAAPGTPVVRDWECLRGMVAAWEGECTPMDGYSMQYTRYFANLCNLGVRPEELRVAAEGAGC